MQLPSITLPLLCLLLPAVAGADQIAQFVETSPINTFVITDNGTSSTLTASSQVDFSFALALGTPFGGADRAATLSWTASSATTASNIAGHLNEGGYSGSFTITDNALGTTLLAGTFGSSGTLNGVAEGSTASFSDALDAAFSSDYLDFSNSTANGFALALSNIAAPPGLSFGGGDFAKSTIALGAGSFSATLDPDLPTSNSLIQTPSVVQTTTLPGTGLVAVNSSLQDVGPEPVTQVMSGVALAILGLFIRRRKLKPAR
jgi:hypothetical protein